MGILKRVWEWLSHGDTVWGILNMILPGVGIAGAAILSWLNSVHPLIWFFAILGGVALGLFISNELAARRIAKRRPLPSTLAGTSPTGFYINRAALTKARGTLPDELSKCQRVWAIFHSGTLTTLSGVLAKCHFERLILTDPEDAYMMQRLEPRGDNTLQYQNQIRQTAEMASKKGSDVRYYAGPIGNSLIIADTIKLADDKFSEQAWAKVETAIPFLSPDDRSSFVIENKDDGKNAFNALLNHFDTTWARSKPIPIEDLSSGRST